MTLVNSAKSGAKKVLRPIFDRLPLEFRAPKVYWSTRELLQKSQRWNEERLMDYQLAQLRRMLQHCAANVPYYRRLFRKIGFDPHQMRRVSDISIIPTLDKEIVRANIKDLLAENIPASKRDYFTTGGTMGKPLGLYNFKDSGWRELAFMQTQWGRVGFEANQLRAILRGSVVHRKRYWAYNPREHAYVFSNFHMTPDHVAEYARVMEEKNIPYLHVYPSSALDFARILKEAEIKPLGFRVVLAGSENLYPGQREAIESFYGCRMYTWYGHSENTALAGECESSHNYHIFPEYGFVEILEDDGSPVNREGEVGELVGTSFYNLVMPLVRYRTGDWALLGPDQCACGRKYKLLKEVRGRWHQEMLVGKLNNRISMTALNMHSAIFDEVSQFQFYQQERGKVELRLVRKPGYSEKDSKAILAAFREKMGDTVDVQLSFKDELSLTSRGKFRFIVQELPQAEMQQRIA
jgi:phenylacetate-CoA ligase